MISAERIQKAGEFVEWLRLSIHEQEIPSNNRVRELNRDISLFNKKVPCWVPLLGTYDQVTISSCRSNNRIKLPS